MTIQFTRMQWAILVALAAGVVVVFCTGAIVLLNLFPSSGTHIAVAGATGTSRLNAESPQPTSPPTLTRVPATATPEPTPTALICSVIDTRDLVKAPERYNGVCIAFIGQVFRISESGSTTTMQVWAMNVGETSSSRAVVVIFQSTLPGIYEGDLLSIVGVGKGIVEGKNAFGASITQPLVVGDVMRKIK